MVSYWKTKDMVEAKVFTNEDGHIVMQMEGEKYPFPGYPRGTLLYGALSPLKHQIKNKIFNDIWAELDKNTPQAEIIDNFRTVTLPAILKLGEETKYDRVPYERMNPPVREIYRAMTAIENGSETMRGLKEIVCFILQEDDAYRMRLQWMAKFFNPNAIWRKVTGRDPLKDFDFALSMMEHGEVIGDMKGRQRLLRRVLMFLLKDPAIKARFDQLIAEIDWDKLHLTKADKYFFRAKYFKVDYPENKY